MAIEELEREGLHIRVSSSISNFKEKIEKNWKKPIYKWTNLTQPCLFIGMYHWIDYLQFILYRGDRIVLWCGSDILNLNWFTKRIFWLFRSIHYCENKIEYLQLLKLGIYSYIQPVFFGDIEKYKDCYKHSDSPHVWLCMHEGREIEYRLHVIGIIAKYLPEFTFHIYGVKAENTDNIIFHGQVSEEQLDEEIKNYQAGLRLNLFDGFSEVLAKSVLLGQHPISVIPYKNITHCYHIHTLKEALKALKTKGNSNEYRDYWYNELKI